MRQELVERARQGDRDAFAQLAAAKVDRLHAIARLTLRDPDLAEDVVQEALVRCWQQLPRLRDPERFDAWLYRILMRAAVDEHRRSRRFETSVDNVSAEPSVGDTSHRVAQRDELEQAFRGLSLDHRAIVVMRHFADLPMPEVAEALGIPLGTAKSRYHHAMNALRASLEASDRLGRLQEARS
jgi:RNA polymerase sigma-70 factor (ECF subfamily)